jgi:SRSO17 transposase
MSVMSVKEISRLGRMLGKFLSRFDHCFARAAGRDLLLVYVRGLMSSVQRKNVEAMALDQKVAPRTLQRLLESIAWVHAMLRDQCQQIVATEHTHPEAIGCIDETGTTKSGTQTAGVKRQYNGNRGKIENCVNSVALSYSAPGFSCLLDAQLYLPDDWVNDPARRKKRTSLMTSNFAQSRKSRWSWCIVQRRMAFASWHGRPMNCTATTRGCSTALMHATKPSSLRFRVIFVCG